MNGRQVKNEVTQLLDKLKDGDRSAFDRAFALVHGELQKLARAQLRRGWPAGHFDTNGLLHEVYLKLVNQFELSLQNRQHFFAIAARAMRQILVDQARRQRAVKRGKDWKATTFTGKLIAREDRLDEVVALDEALDRLEELDQRMHKVVEYKFFGGLTEPEIARLLSVSEKTVRRDWTKARALLYRDLYQYPATRPRFKGNSPEGSHVS